MKRLYGLILALSYLALWGCGQSGPLYLPPEKPVGQMQQENQRVDPHE